MKKSFLAPLFILAFFTSAAYAQFCNCGACVGVGSDRYSCETGGCYPKDGTCDQYCPETNSCPRDTWPPQIVDNGGYGNPNEFCQWAKSCWAIQNGKRDECVQDGAVYINVPSSGQSKSPDDGKQCEGGTWVEGKPPGGYGFGICDWGACTPDPGNPYGCIDGGCFEMRSETEVSDCPRIITSLSQCDPASIPGGSPIISIPKAQGLTVIPNGRSLYILSVRDANVSLYDLAGNRVLNSKVSKGNNTISLTQKQGVYYAVVTSGAQTQTVKVLLK